MRFPTLFLCLLLIAGCASTPTSAPERAAEPSTTEQEATASIPDAPRKQEKAPRAQRGPEGTVNVSVTDVAGRKLPARVVFYDTQGTSTGPFEVASGEDAVQPPVGDYRALVYVYDNKVPILAAVQDLHVTADQAVSLDVNILEGASGKLSIRDFDLDGDLAIDRVEMEVGTNPMNASSIPGHRPLEYNMDVIGSENAPRWYKGELHAVSEYGGGKESVAELIQRAEQAGLDFLAIADLNTMQAVHDPAFHSDKVVLIPAMAWGSKDRGIALIYGPGTEPGPPESDAMAQAECVRIQNQGGVFVAAHPCFSAAPWKWGVRYVNAVQVWNGAWREPSPLRLASLPESLRRREKGDLVYSLAAAAAVADKTSQLAPIAQREDVKVSANDQAALYWDYELVRGAVCSAVGGSMADSPRVPLGQPTTWVYAANKSLPAMMEGLRLGRTFVGNRPDGVQVNFRADVLNDGKVDVGMGGAIPLRVDVGFYILVTGASGGKVQLLRNGHPIMTEIITGGTYSKNFTQTTDYPAVYRVRVIRQPDPSEKGYGPVEVLALSSPIYAADIGTELLMTGPVDFSKTWIQLESEYTEDDRRVPR